MHAYTCLFGVGGGVDEQVIMGGGRKFMLPKNTSDVEYPGEKKYNGTRKDGRNLIQEWINRTKNKVREPKVHLKVKIILIINNITE